jgi:signal peptide peptidase SppA
MREYGHIISYVMNTPWAIVPEKLATIVELVRFYADGNRFTAAEVKERIGAAARPGSPSGRITGAVAVLPLQGVIAHRMNLMTETSGGTSVEAFRRQLQGALADPQVGAIAIDVDSPGGSVDGIDELSSEIFRARGQKPIVAVANAMAASAAYWIATAADELVVTPSGEVGSIGVIAAHEDASGLYEQMGVKTSLITAGKYKGEGNPYEPLGEEARAAIQERVDGYYDMFVRAVARNRGVGVAEVREGFGQGRVVGAKQAKGLGMVDRVATLDETVERLMSRRQAKAQAAAELETRQRRLRAAGR